MGLLDGGMALRRGEMHLSLTKSVDGDADHVALWMLEAIPPWRQVGLGRPILSCAHALIHGASPFEMHGVETLEHRHYGWCLEVGCGMGSRSLLPNLDL